jgi:hypothetical protein
VGYSAGATLTTGERNCVLGYEALDGATTETDDNVAIGFASMGGAIGTEQVNECIAIGTYALGGALTSTNGVDEASGTIAIGVTALVALTDGAGNIGIGRQALTALTTGDGNTAVGYTSLTTNVDGSYNTAVGYESLYTFEADTLNHGDNTAVGYQSGKYISIGTNNTYVGKRAGWGNSVVLSGNNNSAFGDAAGYLLQGSATNNTLIGKDAGSTLTTGTQNTILGKGSATDDATATNQTVIGYLATAVADNSVTLGNDDVTAVYMASDSGATVHCAGVVSNSNHAVEGYSTGRNVLRSIRLRIYPGGTPNTNISVDHDTTAGRSFNTPTLTDGVDIANDSSNGSFALNDGSTRINVDVSNAIGMISESILTHDLNSSSTSEMYFTNTVIISSDLSIAIMKRGSQSLVDWRTIIDAGDSITILISYISSS